MALSARFIPVSEDFERFQTATEEAGSGKPAGIQTEEFKYFHQMLAQARLLDKRGEPAAILGDGCHTQGMYMLTPSGRVLGMMHQWDQPALYVKMLKRGLERWAEVPAEERRLSRPPARDRGRLGNIMKSELYPADGLVLREITRALPYEPALGPRYDKAIASHPVYARLDQAWYRKQEARQFLPARIEPGAGHAVPRKVLNRLVLFHLGTNTDTIAGPFGDNTIREARLAVAVVAVNGHLAELTLQGATRVDGPQDSADGKNSGYRANLLGRAVYDLKAERFVEFDLVALGIRHHGGNEVRQDTPNPIPLAVLLTLAGTSPADRLPPAYLDRYGW